MGAWIFPRHCWQHRDPAPRAPAAFTPGSTVGIGRRRVLLPLDGATPIHDPELVMPVADALLLRDPAGALLLQRAGNKRVLEPEACKGRIVHADARRELFIVGCAQKKTGRVSLELVNRERAQTARARARERRTRSRRQRFSAAGRVVPGLGHAHLRRRSSGLQALQAGDVVIATSAGHALVRRRKTLLFYDADTHQRVHCRSSWTSSRS